MRLVIDTLIAVMLVAVLALVLMHHRGQQRVLRQQEQVQHALVRLQDQTLFHAALGEAPRSAEGFATTVSPAWFAEGVPVNPVVPGNQPWIDLAPAQDISDNPPDPVITRREQAGFWYSPRRGIFRARVLPQFTDSRTVALYNALNGTHLESLAKPADADARTPVSMAPAPPAPEPAAHAAPAPPPSLVTLRHNPMR